MRGNINMLSAVGVIFANLHDSSLPELTSRRTMASVPFGCRYRLIDFPLSNMVNSGITNIGVVVHDNYRSLVDHISTGKDWDLARRSGGIKILPPFITAFGNSGVEAVGRGVRNLFMWLVGITTALITGTLALQTLIDTASDSTAMRAARYAASGMIPVVGSTVSGALSTLAAGLTYAKSFIGVGAILVIVTFALSPLIMLLLYRFALSAVIIFSDFVGIGGGAKIFGAYRFVIDSVVTLYALSALVYVLEIILFIKCGVAVL
jgi:hypothetical protein